MNNINEILSKLTSEEQAELLKQLNAKSETEKTNSVFTTDYYSIFYR